MKIADRECLPLLTCNVRKDDGMLRLNKIMAFRLINGNPVSFASVIAEFSYREPYYTIPLRVVPLYWFLRILHILGLKKSRWYHMQWDKIGSYQSGDSRVYSRITDFKIGLTLDE